VYRFKHTVASVMILAVRALQCRELVMPIVFPSFFFRITQMDDVSPWPLRHPFVDSGKPEMPFFISRQSCGGAI
jgi:hypothetical protein